MLSTEAVKQQLKNLDTGKKRDLNALERTKTAKCPTMTSLSTSTIPLLRIWQLAPTRTTTPLTRTDS
jgi:hypothetical protein